nr:RAQPRD family integrative conjugative element protein [Rhizobium sp. ACO-34A]
MTALLLGGLTLTQPAAADDDSQEREHLAAVVRQIELAGRLAQQSATAAPRTRTRYHFDYRRLNADLNRIRAGINDYLAPPREQPRDPSALTGDYRRETSPETAK